MQHTELDEDEGLQPERTSLSWFRTALGFAGVAALTIRQAPTGNGRFAAFLVTALVMLAVTASSAIRSRQLRVAQGAPTVVARPVLLASTAAGLVVLDVLAVVLFA